VDLSSRLRHRGPDWSGAVIHGKNIFAHERLSIVGLLSGEQPMLSTDQEIIITVNGEIYNYKELMATALKGTYEYQTGSDCEVLLYLVCRETKLLDRIFLVFITIVLYFAFLR
jgi:asparagine synthase (glutamine-hydrolysing)